jgi:hypothetical protein
VRAKHLSTHAFGVDLGQGGALALIIGALGVGSFLATAVGTRLHIHRPALLQAGAMVLVTALGVVSLVRFNLGTLTLLSFGTAVASQLAKLAIDATIQERIDESVRASAFAHSETVLMLAWVLGGGIGLVPFGAWWGVALVVAVLTLLTARGLQVAVALRKEKLTGVASGEVPPAPPVPEPTTRRVPGRTRRPRPRTPGDDAEPTPTKPLRVEEATTEAVATRVLPRDDTEPDAPGYHLYRPSGTPPSDEDDDD